MPPAAPASACIIESLGILSAIEIVGMKVRRVNYLGMHELSQGVEPVNQVANALHWGRVSEARS